MTKEKLSKLASIDNAQSNKFLEEFAIKERAEIVKSKSNDDIFEHLGFLKVIYHKVPSIVIDTIEYLVYKKPLKPILTQSVLGEFEGKTHDEILRECLEILMSVRYYDLEKVIQISFDMYKHKNTAVQSSAVKLIEEFSEYNPDVLSKIGLIPQIKALAFLEKEFKTASEQEKNLQFITTVLHQIFETSSRSYFSSSPNTITFRSGDVFGHPNLFKLRTKALKYSVKVYQNLKQIESKVSFFTIFEYACHMPMNSSNESELGVLIQKNREYLILKLKSLFIKKGKIVQPFALCLQFEHLLHWYFIHLGLQTNLAISVINQIDNDRDYELFSRFVHDDSDRIARRKNKELPSDEQHIESYINLVPQRGEKEVLNELIKIATQALFVDEWKFFAFKRLLETLGEKYPEKAFKFANDSLDRKTALSNKYFLPWLLSGIRSSKEFDLWDKISVKILSSKDVTLTSELIGSIFVSQTMDEGVPVRKKEDIQLLTDLIKRRNKFNFLKKEKPDNLLRHFTINALRKAYASSPRKVELLIIEEMKNNIDYFLGYMHTVSPFVKQFKIGNWSASSKSFFLNQFVVVDDLDWHMQDLLPLLCNKPEDVIALFIKRIKLRNKKLTNYSFTDPKRRMYDAVPYHINPDLIQYVGKGNLDNVVEVIIKNLPSKYGVDSIELAQLIKHFGINPSDILKKLSQGEATSDSIIRKVLISISSMDPNDIDFLVELAGKTSNESIHRSIYGRVTATGVVSGEFGIADAYKMKWMSLEKYLDSDNKNIRKFVEMAIKWLKDSEERSRKEAVQDIEKRRVDFESGQA